ncbi:glycosyltransferase family 2 protein [Serratia silvae]|uniref:Glycosyltransferase family 2 protein n=1 Tax=Serratia silvae TaxID=2824122 RepID=A0ABT0KHM6_9GAMM|nr:glycosyltransferase family 2 protein [Serratia silvae]MCL1031427.1 glycosyltransferase family 2 protein [Serratia silvae]
MKITIVVPTYNGGNIWRLVAKKISENVSPTTKVIVIDSQSKDQSVLIAEDAGFSIIGIHSSEFNHGGTRNLAVEHADGDIVIFLTQDAIPCEGFIEHIIETFSDESVAVSFGRQLPHVDANPLAIHARIFNYKEIGYTTSLEDTERLGIKSVFTSNSFAAYRKSIFERLGGFPSNTILSEDMYFAAKAVKAGYKVCYCAAAQVHHSHNYTPMEEFKRYFDIGVFHYDESWIRKSFGNAGGEGRKFIMSEINYLLKNHPLWIPRAFLHNFLKITAYKLGLNYRRIPRSWVPHLSMHRRFWQ